MLKFIFSLFAGVSAAIAFWKFFYASFLLTPLVFLAITIIVWRLLKKIINKKEKVEEEDSTPDSQKAMEISANGIKRIVNMRNKTRMISNNEVAGKIQDICKVGVEIFEDVKKNPADIKKIKTFYLYYLESTEKIVNQYVDLLNRKDRTPEIEKSLEKVEKLLDQIKETFEKQLANLLEDDLLDLDVELSVLKKTMTYEG